MLPLNIPAFLGSPLLALMSSELSAHSNVCRLLQENSPAVAVLDWAEPGP